MSKKPIDMLYEGWCDSCDTEYRICEAEGRCMGEIEYERRIRLKQAEKLMEDDDEKSV